MRAHTRLPFMAIAPNPEDFPKLLDRMHKMPLFARRVRPEVHCRQDLGNLRRSWKEHKSWGIFACFR
jgi:hypothetical protein